MYRTSTLLLQIFKNEGNLEMDQFGKWVTVLIGKGLIERDCTSLRLTAKGEMYCIKNQRSDENVSRSV